MRYKIDTIEPFWWALFMAGAGVIGLLFPIHIFVQGIALPVGVVNPLGTATHLSNLLGNPIVKLYLFVLISLPLFHWAHRFRYFLFDLGLHGGRKALEWICYGLAVLGTIYAAYTLITL